MISEIGFDSFSSCLVGPLLLRELQRTGGEVFSMILEALPGDLCDFKSSRSSRPPSEVQTHRWFLNARNDA